MNKLAKEPVVISIVMLFGGIPNIHQYGYYTLLRIIVCLTSSYLAFFAFHNQKRAWGWLFSFCLILFNPFITISFGKATWASIDFVVALLMLFFLFEELSNIKNKRIIVRVFYFFIILGIIVIGFNFCSDERDLMTLDELLGNLRSVRGGNLINGRNK